jgi:hypothetical protein
MDTAYIKMREYLIGKFGDKVPYFSIGHKLTFYGCTDDSTTIEWSVYVTDYDWHRAPTIEEAIALLDEEISPSSPGCIGVGV